MSDPEGGGGHEEKEAPAWNNLWGYKESVGDPLQFVHDAPDAWNGMNQTFGLTQTAQNANSLRNSAGLAEHLAQNAEAMGNTGMAERFASRASAYEAFSTERGGLNALMESPAMKIGGNVTGGVLGGLQMYNGLNEWQHGNKTQGAMDMGAGGLGVAGSGLGLASAAGLIGETGALATMGAVAAPAAVVAGLAAAGNSYTKDHNLLAALGIGKWNESMWGKNPDGSNRDSLQFVGQTTASAYHGVDNAIENKLGHGAFGHTMGMIGGGLAGAGTAIGTGATALVGDVAGGLVAVGSGLGSLGAAAGRGIASGASAVGRGIGSAASAVGSGIGHAASAIGSGIGGAAKSVGNFVSHLW